MKNIDTQIAKIIGSLFSMDSTAPNKLVGRVCTLRLENGDSIISYETTIKVVYYRVFYTSDGSAVVAEINFVFDGGALGKINFPTSRQNEEGIDLSELTDVVFEKLPVYIQSKGSGNITIHQP